MPQSAETARRVTERWILIAGATALVLGVLLGLLIFARGNDALCVDAAWMEEIVEHRHPWWEVPSRIMDVLGGGLMSILISLTIVTLLFAIGPPLDSALLRPRHPRAAPWSCRRSR